MRFPFCLKDVSDMIRYRHALVIPIAVALLLCGCGVTQPPIYHLTAQLKDAPEYSILLDDMEERGEFVPSYYQKYRVVAGDQVRTTDWLEVPEDYYRKTEPYLGMALVVKKDGKVSDVAQPPGYAYVGDEKYGTWKQDNQGNSFWEFYGKYALLSHLLGMGTGRIYRHDYDMYNQYRTQGRTYYGQNRQYGTNGTLTKQEKPNFYARRQQREAMRKSSFADRVGSRVGRTKTGLRGRGGSWGK